MAIKRILDVSNPDDRKILKTRSRPAQLPNLKVKQLVQDLLETLYATPTGVGLSAPQIGVLLRVVVVGMRPVYKPLEDGTEELVQPGVEHVLINPQIVKRSEECELDFEGCLSIPGLSGEVARASRITVDYFDVAGKKHRLKGVDGFVARVFQHEIDHLDGILFPDRVTNLSRLFRTAPRRDVPPQGVL